MAEVCGSLAPAFADRTHEEPTQRVYGRLWDKFEPDEAPREAHRLLEDRLRGSSFDLASLAGKSVLDCGCGCGRYTIALALSGAAPVFGTDLGAASIETAREMAQRANVSDIDFHVADALDLPFEDAKFDFVLSNGVLHHTTDMTHGLREMWRVMKPDGRAFLYVSATGGLFWYSRQRIPDHLPLVRNRRSRIATMNQ